MTKSYANAAAFRQALEARLKAVAEQRSVQIQGVRLKVAIERLLARLFHAANPPWLLKGGYSMELRFRPRARTTRDVDLTVGDSVAPEQLKGKLEELHEALQAAAEQPLNDFFEFLIEPARREIEAAPGGGGVFGVVAAMGGRDFARFHLDVGFGDCVMARSRHWKATTCSISRAFPRREPSRFPRPSSSPRNSTPIRTSGATERTSGRRIWWISSS